VLQLTNIEMSAEVPFGPAQEEIAGRLHHPTTVHDSLAVVGVRTLTRIGCEDRRTRLLELEEQGIVLLAIRRMTPQTVPTLPTPTTLIAKSMYLKRSSSRRLSS